MTAGAKPVGSIDDYIAAYPPSIQAILGAVRTLIQDVAPDATEKMAYGIPTFHLHGNLVHFAAYSGHIGFYPGSSGIAAFAEEIASFRSGKGSVRFPIDEPMPVDLIRRIVVFRVEENLQQAAVRRR